MYNRALEMDALDPRTLNNLGALQVLQSRDADALATLTTALAVNPACVECLANLASMHHVRGDPA